MSRKLSGLPPAIGRLSPPLTPPDRASQERRRNQERDAADPSRKWYHLKRWKELRLAIADRDGWTCQATGTGLTATPNRPNSLIVDHKRPHKGDPALFWDPENLHAVSKAWHDAEKQRLDHAAGHHRKI